tara:strand:+ start:5091 stop:6332 length:1242 start_codon:yes stop_codon:yes gene_type:complete
MSLQTLKLKAMSSATNQANSTLSKEGFSLNSGPRQLNYTGKSMRNSSYKTPFKGNYPVNFNGNVDQHITYSAGESKVELRGSEPALQKPVKSNKAMLSSKYKWIQGGVYPNVWVQTPQKTYSEYLRDLHCPCDDISSSSVPPVEACDCKKAFGDMGVNLNHTRIQRLKLENSKIVNIDVKVKPVSQSERIQKIQCDCLTPKCDNKPFPYFTTNPGMKTSGLISCGGASEAQHTYKSAPKWYIDCSGEKVTIEESPTLSFEKPTPLPVSNGKGYMFNIIYNDTMPVPRFALYTLQDNKRFYVILGKSSSGIDGNVVRNLGSVSYASLFSINDSIYDPDLVFTTVIDEETYFLYTGGNIFMLFKAEPKNKEYAKRDNVSLDNIKEDLSYQNKIVTKARYYDTDTLPRNFYAELIR